MGEFAFYASTIAYAAIFGYHWRRERKRHRRAMRMVNEFRRAVEARSGMPFDDLVVPGEAASSEVTARESSQENP